LLPDPEAVIEGFWSIFKRGIVGTFHNVSAPESVIPR